MPACAGQDQRDVSAFKCLQKKQKSGFDPQNDRAQGTGGGGGSRGCMPRSASGELVNHLIGFFLSKPV
jgi:hypothetical protein